MFLLRVEELGKNRVSFCFHDGQFGNENRVSENASLLIK